MPLRVSYGNPYAYSIAWDGGCTLVPEVATLDDPSGVCTYSCEPGNGYFTAFAAWIDILEGGAATVKLFYDPGDPSAQAVGTCSNGGPLPPFELPRFAGFYLYFHANERVQDFYQASGYFAKAWQLLRTGPGPSQNGEFFAKKSYEEQRLGGLSEETWIFLKHTPGKPMPDCP